ncbi:hypothetical protein [Aeromicrobium sp. 9AM]|uniref:hypothetical protein n=1 Tax=Aeromicrobium sp. 9AM TaxID=2653126 RepID=UPI0012F3527F|nr:hypothetical protein [Aeromicrobium sp. 9AM]VXC07813.1 hypothetical protein AERO9AM_30622 [Aeromicrobium sp. 9AM]
MRPTTDDLDQQQRVRARYASRNETRCVGTIIAYSERPMVCIQTDDGEHVWWVADITDRLDDETGPAPEDQP